MSEHLLEIKGLKVHFPTGDGGWFGRGRQYVKAVDGLDFSIRRGETLGIVGESGCGKSTTGRALLRLVPATEGQVLFEGRNILRASSGDMRGLRREMQIIFQDPYASLDPRMTVGGIIGEAFKAHERLSSREREEQVQELLSFVGLRPEHIRRYPHEFSGGQRQRIGIARALALRPKFVVCDEPVSALDVSIQAQVVNLMKELQQKLELTYLFISHDLRVVKHISDRVGVMYLGAMVEIADKRELYANPQHPYTRALLSAIPQANPSRRRERIILQGDVPSPVNPPSGCRFRTRCPEATERCALETPAFKDLGGGHRVACHYR
ncbi:ABC transporter ATP-binding protein [Cohnella fermenti]|uniref:Dipeptide ABC transporter ATP-binding protein n=1 Tax=Cohnella fermenti TaxID=2565925 RepID=A0A4V3WGP3_9BACL|nr:dipeptide ABC transporter ATP-binding protein [Cohnella fermenti]THF84566.1 dipeptide ABC transporter ATP-binding protein [Cohnella fermenti]